MLNLDSKRLKCQFLNESSIYMIHFMLGITSYGIA
jgi:hypothetical protein